MAFYYAFNLFYTRWLALPSVIGAVMFILSFTANEQVIVVSQSVLTDPYHGAQTHYVARSDYYLSVEELYNDP